MLLRRKTTGLLAAGLAAALALTACGGDDEGGEDNGSTRSAPGFEECADDPVNCNSGEVAEGGEITWAISGGFERWNTNANTGNSVYLLQAMEGLLPSTGRFRPDGEWGWNTDLLAKDGELVSESPQTWQYTIRKEAVWDDGTPIGADDFILYWYMLSGNEDHCTGGCDTASTTYAAQVESITEEEDGDGNRVVSITLKDGESNPEWAYSDPIAYPAYVAEREAAGWKEDPDQMAAAAEYFGATIPNYSGGPYLLDDATVGEQVIKVPNPAWYGETKPSLDKVIQVVVPDQQATLTAVQNGEIGGASPASLDPDVAEQAAGIPGVYSNLGKGPSWEHIDLNTTHEWLQDKELRRAIFTAIDVDEINERTYGQLLPVERRTNHILREDSPHHEDVITATGQGSGDVEAAKQILTDAGYEIVDGKLTKDGEAAPAIGFRHLEGHTMRTITAELVQSQLAEIGLDIQLSVIPVAELSATLAEGDFDMIVFGWSGTPAFTTAPNQFYHSTSGSNFGQNKNEDLDAVLTTIRQTPDIAESGKRTNEALKLVVDDAYVLPLVTTPVLIMVSDQYANVRDTWSSSLRAMYNMHEWGVRAS